MAAHQVAISVLVPIYNVDRYLEQCLSSIRDQSFSDFEVLCINDGSTDSSRAIIQRFLDEDERFRVIDKPNSGYGASMNLGLKQARGVYMAILESDDFYEPDALSKLYTAAQENDSDVVKGDFWLYWSPPQERMELFHVVDSQQGGRTLRPLDDVAVFFRKPSIWSALYRREFLVNQGIDFLETPGASYQDAGFNFKVWASAERATFISEPVLFYRQDNEGSSINSAAKVFCVCDEYAAMESYLNGCCSGSDGTRLLAILERMKYDSYLWNYDRLDASLRPSFVECISREFARDLDAGKVDLSLFEPGARAGLMLLSSDPQRFSKLRMQREETGSVRYYLTLGGPLLVLSVVAHRLFSHSVRRTNARGGSE